MFYEVNIYWPCSWSLHDYNVHIWEAQTSNASCMRPSVIRNRLQQMARMLCLSSLKLLLGKATRGGRNFKENRPYIIIPPWKNCTLGELQFLESMLAIHWYSNRHDIMYDNICGQINSNEINTTLKTGESKERFRFTCCWVMLKVKLNQNKQVKYHPDKTKFWMPAARTWRTSRSTDRIQLNSWWIGRQILFLQSCEYSIGGNSCKMIICLSYNQNVAMSVRFSEILCWREGCSFWFVRHRLTFPGNVK